MGCENREKLINILFEKDMEQWSDDELEDEDSMEVVRSAISDEVYCDYTEETAQIEIDKK